jgi:hypothetical protein
LIYSVTYGLLAFPYWLVSVVNFLDINVFFHTLMIILFSEAIVDYFRKKIKKIQIAKRKRMYNLNSLTHVGGKASCRKDRIEPGSIRNF